ncbi:FAD-binding oxidoreductase [Allopusillimonas soli]|uniref:FAD-binding oxidoreductase n=1 Tax=Allopusillimonas soli TaxID=659016 RepID=A0A853F910_9BURK|nr:FAD-dependent oxidoreductase [Allopusillimonas soli]NYT36467.1 FAD-binding oxidoreductase [Allopusillimonas soli]TEA74973.1 FAD-binding oxidoreductase [Allopusillimonas soli]
MAAPDHSAAAIVIGGGLHGSSVALHLARAGVHALVLEKNYVGRHASGVNAGGVRTLARHLAEIPLSLASLALWKDIENLVDDDCGFEQHGQILVAENEADLATLQTRLQTLSAQGYIHEQWLAPSALCERIPAINPSVRGGIMAAENGAADPYRTTLAFRRKAESLGARFREGVLVKRVERVGRQWSVSTETDVFTTPVIVNCAGAWADRIASQLGEDVPLEAIAPMMLVTLPMPHFLDPVVIGSGRPLSFKQRANGTVLIGGGRRARVNRDTNWTELDFHALAEGARVVCELFPHMRQAVINRGWAGIEARMPDDIPVIGPSIRHENAFHAFGFSAHGFELGPIVGKIIADLITEGFTDLPIEPFRIDRFALGNGAAATGDSGR